MTTPPVKPQYSSPEEAARIYLLPNLFTAGNLFCGFLALTKIVEADLTGATGYHEVKMALLYILVACILDLLDGRVARMGGFESPFGREFDSLADIVSFGVAPAFLVHRVVLADVGCCGRSLISTGMLAEAREEIARAGFVFVTFTNYWERSIV